MAAFHHAGTRHRGLGVANVGHVLFSAGVRPLIGDAYAVELKAPFSMRAADRSDRGRSPSAPYVVPAPRAAARSVALNVGRRRRDFRGELGGCFFQLAVVLQAIGLVVQFVVGMAVSGSRGRGQFPIF